LSHVKSFVWSGASAPKSLAETLNKLRRKHGARLYNGYGMTETAGFVTYSDDDDSVETLLTSAGKAPAPFELRIVDEQRKEIKSGAVGEIAVRGPILMKEYWRNPEATAEAFDEEGWFYTRDLAWKDSSGRIHIAGRKSEMFKSGGEKVFPQEIESVIETHPGVAAVAVVAVPDPVYTEVGRAFIVLKQGRTPDLDELRAYCRDHLANFKVPKHFEFRKHLPLLPNGKIDKRALRAETLKE
jgi:acyl-CoA synthetase (AMP-forming)/AMP-acid ligase II